MSKGPPRNQSAGAVATTVFSTVAVLDPARG
ncbi:hypothetical protein I306_06905 [Cryptococcus gattii EJB2]|uniref:Uncharacterized protein n=1 Tax=Cryptococcus gattii EJB2 TaxID=1296103 RepID=A0ABR5BKF1_9TREE|nr:hypothetical protein I306_06905 [Cryptococcus gattii EJB2]